MGSFQRYRCRSCRFQARVGGPEEFYLDPEGQRLRYGHPEPCSPEAEERGVDGFWMHLWCESCAVVKPMVTVQFEAPCEPLEAWSGRGRMRPGFPADADRCPDCQGLLSDEIRGLESPCPRCGQPGLACEPERD